MNIKESIKIKEEKKINENSNKKINEKDCSKTQGSNEYDFNLSCLTEKIENKEDFDLLISSKVIKNENKNNQKLDSSLDYNTKEKKKESNSQVKLTIKSILSLEEILDLISSVNLEMSYYNSLDLDTKINLLLFNEENQKILFKSFSLLSDDHHNKLLILFTKYPNKIFKKPKSLNLLVKYYEMTSYKHRIKLIETFDFHVISSFPELFKNIKKFLNLLFSNKEKLIIYTKLISLEDEELEKVILDSRSCFFIDYIISEFLTIDNIYYNTLVKKNNNHLINFIMKKFVFYGISNNSTFVVQSLIRNFFNKTIYSYLMNNVQELTEHKNGIFVYSEFIYLNIKEKQKIEVLKMILLNSEKILKTTNGPTLLELVIEVKPYWAIEFFYNNFSKQITSKLDFHFYL